MRRLLFGFRPLALAFAGFIVLNLAIAIGNTGSSATRVFLNLDLPEPILSVFASVLGLAILVPHAAAERAWVRWLLSGVIFGFCILVGANVIGYYHRLHSGVFRTDFRFPFSAIILAVLLAEFARVSFWIPARSKMPPAAWCFLRVVLIGGAFFFLIGAHIVTFGHTDYRRHADAAIILGAKVKDDGQLSDALRARVDTGIRLYHEKFVSYLIMSGSIGPNGRDESEYMAYYAQQRGVPLSRIIKDSTGGNTRKSARNCGKIARRRGFKNVLTVSQGFHCARVKLIFEREGLACFTVPARLEQTVETERAVVRPSFPLLREVFAYPFYFLYYS